MSGYREYIRAGLIVIATIALSGCSFSHSSGYRMEAAQRPAGLGATAVAIQSIGGISKHVDRDKLAAAVEAAIRTAPGTTVVMLPDSPAGVRRSDYELLLAARQMNAQSLCIVNIDNMGSRITLGIGIPPYEANSFANFQARILAVNDGRLLVESVRWEATYDPFFEPPAHSVNDLQRGIERTLQYGGYTNDGKAKSSEPPATQPTAVTSVR